MKNAACILMIPLILLLGVMVAAPEPVLQQRLRLTAGEWAPLVNKTHDGFLDRIILEATRRVGIEAEIVFLPNTRALKAVNEGEYDGNLVRIAGLEKQFPHLIPVPEKVLDAVFVAFTTPELTLHGEGWERLHDRHVVLIRGWQIYEEAIDKIGVRTALPVTEATQLFRMLQAGRAELALYELWSGRELLKQLGIDDIHVVEPPLAVRELFLYLHERHAALAPKIAAALRDMKQDGSYQRLVDELLKPLLEPGVNAP